MTNSKRWMPHLTSAAVFVAGVAFTSIALAQVRRSYPMREHPIGSEIVDRLAPSETKGMLNYMAADSRGAILPKSLDGRAQYTINARRDASEPERHAEADDARPRAGSGDENPRGRAARDTPDRWSAARVSGAQGTRFRQRDGGQGVLSRGDLIMFGALAN